MDLSALDVETRDYFNALPAGLRETIIQSGAAFQTAEELRTLVSGFQPLQ